MSQEENDWEEDELLMLLNHRIRIFENLADDALSLLSIQLLVAPISISTISFITKIGAKLGETSTSLSKILESVDIGLVTIGISFATVSVSLTILSYYIARRKASRYPNNLIDIFDSGGSSSMETIENVDSMIERIFSEDTLKYRIYNDLLSPAGGTYLEAQRKYGELGKTPSDKIVGEFDSQYSIERLLRTTLFFSLILSLGAFTLMLIGILESVIPSASRIAKLLLLLSLVFLLYFIPIAIVVGYLEQVFVILNKSFNFLTHILDKLSQRINIWQIIRNHLLYIPMSYTSLYNYVILTLSEAISTFGI